MKRISILFTIAASVAMLASCAKGSVNQEQQPMELQRMTISVAYPESTTKVLLDDEDGVLLWGSEESLAVVFNGKTVLKFDKVSETVAGSAKFSALIDPLLKMEEITEVFYPYNAGYTLADYRAYEVSTTQSNIALVQGRYDVSMLPLHWKGNVFDGVTLTAEQSAIVFISKDDIKIVDDAVSVAIYSDDEFIQEYTVTIGPDEDLVFIVDIPRVQGERIIIHPRFVLNRGKGDSSERGAIRTSWITSNNTQKSMVPSKRYALYPYIVLFNAESQTFSKLNTKDLNDAMIKRTIYKANWQDVAGSQVLGHEWSYNETEILFNGKPMYYTNSATGACVKMTPSTTLIDTDRAVLSSHNAAAGTDRFIEEEYNPFENMK